MIRSNGHNGSEKNGSGKRASVKEASVPVVSFLSGKEPPDRLLRALKPDTHLGRFVIERPLNRHSCVYLARDTVIARPVAIKIARDDAAVARLRREQQLYARVSHRHVLRTFDLHAVIWRNLDLTVLSMEFADGGNLRQWEQSQRSSAQDRRSTGLAYFRQCCLGVGALHQAGIVHLDLKPENVLLVGGVARVAVLGSARSLGPDDAIEENGDTPAPLGTAPYMSPELSSQLDPAGLQADIYSLGVILYEILCPDAPPLFDPDQPGDIAQGQLPALSNLDPSHAHVIRRCLHVDPLQRYRSISELLGDLDGHNARSQSASQWQQVRQHLDERQTDEARRLCRMLARIPTGHNQLTKSGA